ncbi:MAG: ArsR family transcriptional regulator [archaeon]
MLKIFNNLEMFFEDNYLRVNVREYARLMNISPPSASTLLASLENEGLLKSEKEHRYIFYSANRENMLFVELCKAYWRMRFKKIGLLDYLQEELVNPLVVLFGSFSKAEIKQDSDIDMAVFSVTKKELDLRSFEKKLKRNMQLFAFKDEKDVLNKELLKNIRNGFVLLGRW